MGAIFREQTDGRALFSLSQDEEDEVRQKAVTEIIGRAQLSAEEVGALMQPSAEARAVLSPPPLSAVPGARRC